MALRPAIALFAVLLAAPALAQNTPAPKAAAPKAAPELPHPPGAPQDDYEFTAWCYGALRQHMELYKLVEPELHAIGKRLNTEKEDFEGYAEQQQAGQQTLAQFQRALEAAEKASPRNISTRGAAAITQGRKVWDDIGKVDRSNQAYSWMNWGLPDKCVSVSASLENRSVLMAPALKANTPAAKAPAPTTPAKK